MPITTFLKLLRCAMGYGSRSERIKRMLEHPDLSVQMMAHSLVAQGLLDQITGSVNVP